MILIGNRVIKGILRGYDDFMNLVLDQAKEIVNGNENGHIGMTVIRGNSIVRIEQLSNTTQSYNNKIDIDAI